MSSVERLPLAVDLDGTLSRTNSIVEQVVALARTRPWMLPSLLASLGRGRPAFKRRLQELSPIERVSLPFHPSFVAYLEAEAARGRDIVLVTAADQSTATHVASLFPFFGGGVGSTGDVNLSGRRKGAYLAERYGEKRFAYAGNELRDVLVWERAGAAVVVNPSTGLVRAAQKAAPVERVFDDRPPRLLALARSLRPHHWFKNVLIFVPVFTAHRLGDADALVPAIVAFAAFSAAASGAYVLNDLMDLPSDRAHARKKLRPFASGDLPVGIGLLLFPVLLACAASLSLWLPVSARAVLAAYVAITLLYTFLFKKVLLLDVVVLAGLYALRLAMGSAAADIPPSRWLVAFAVCMLLSLALLKRYCELRAQGDGYAPGRGYHVDHLAGIGIAGVACGILAAAVMAFYPGSAHVTTLYATPLYLYLLSPLFLGWILRMWWLGYRGRMLEDPVLFTLHDLFSVGVVALTVLVVALAR